MCCDHCHRPIQPGTERTLWDEVKHCVWVCATCFAFLASAAAQATPPQQPRPLLMYSASPIVAANTNTSSALMTYSTVVGPEHKP